MLARTAFGVIYFHIALTVCQRTPNRLTPLHNRKITPEEECLAASHQSMCRTPRRFKGLISG
jgi:hypothetical protein